jgi:4-hydroxy-tetrahydrodipicolinate synthase
VDNLTRLHGIVTVLNTPFTADDAVDVDALQAHVEHAIGAGVAGFLVPALASEVTKLSEAERLLIVKSVLEVARGRAVVIGGASAVDAPTREQAARQLIALGCDGILAAIPYVTDEAMIQQVQALDALQPGLLMLQDWDFQGYGIPVPLIVHLFETVPSFRSLKIEVVPAGVKYSEVLRATGGRLHVAGGWAVTQMIEALDRGVPTLMPTGLHPIYVAIYQRYHAGDRDGAVALFRRLLPILAFSNQHLDISVHFFKRLLHRQGIYPTARVRPPILPFDLVHECLADALISEAIDWMKELDHA